MAQTSTRIFNIRKLYKFLNNTSYGGYLPAFLSFRFLKTDTMTNRLPSTSTMMVVMRTHESKVTPQGKRYLLSRFAVEMFLRGASVPSTILNLSSWDSGEGSCPPVRVHQQRVSFSCLRYTLARAV